MEKQINKEFYQSAMQKGTMLGVVWSIMYLLLFAGTANMFAISLCLTLYMASPFIAARLAIKYRREECNNQISYLQALIFLIYMYICATLLTTFVTYIYFAFIDGGTFFMTLQNMLEEVARTAGTDELLAQQIEQTNKIIEQTTTNNLVWQVMNNNLISSTIMPIIIAVFVKRKV